MCPLSKGNIITLVFLCCSWQFHETSFVSKMNLSTKCFSVFSCMLWQRVILCCKGQLFCPGHLLQAQSKWREVHVPLPSADRGLHPRTTKHGRSTVQGEQLCSSVRQRCGQREHPQHVCDISWQPGLSWVSDYVHVEHTAIANFSVQLARLVPWKCLGEHVTNRNQWIQKLKRW